MNIIYLNGEYIPEDQAKISIFDRGFMFGDSVYEVIALTKGKLIAADQHFKRLENSLQAIDMKMPLPREAWLSIFDHLLVLNGQLSANGAFYLQITRGTEGKRHHAIPQNLSPTVLAFYYDFVFQNDYEKLQQGFSVITAEDIRWTRCFIKSTNLLPNILLYEQARRAGAAEVILLKNGKVTECTSSNVFIVKAGTIMTPALNQHILGGATRELVLDLAKKNNIPCQEIELNESALREADEIWITASGKTIYPIILLDGKPVNNGQVGPVWHQMMHHYEDYKATL